MNRDARFDAKYAVTPGCWIWTAALNSAGYGVFSHQPYKLTTAHRYAYERWEGLVPSGHVIDHVCHSSDLLCPGGRCEHRKCVNPAHLEAVFPSENVLRGHFRDTRKIACPSGHAYDETNTRWTAVGYQECITCRRETGRRFEAKMRAKV